LHLFWLNLCQNAFVRLQKPAGEVFLTRLCERLVAFVLGVAALGIPAFATPAPQESDPQATNPTVMQATKPSIHIPEISQPPTLEQFENMAPHGPATQMAEVSEFIQQLPSDGAPPTQKTQVYLGYDKSNLYIVWLCFDAEPGKIRAHMEQGSRLVRQPVPEYSQEKLVFRLLGL
jgi:hypothetical protein